MPRSRAYLPPLNGTHTCHALTWYDSFLIIIVNRANLPSLLVDVPFNLPGVSMLCVCCVYVCMCLCVVQLTPSFLLPSGHTQP